MNREIIERINNEANYMVETKQTMREIAKKFNVSKSTVHKDLSERIKKISIKQYKEIEPIIQEHLETRHIRGGESTKKKYKLTK